MTRKDYIALADAIRFSLPIEENSAEYLAQFHGVRRTAFSISDVLARDNSRFDRERFLKACGVQS